MVEKKGLMQWLSVNRYYIAALAFMAGAVALLVGKLFLEEEINDSTIALFLIVWVPVAFPLIQRLNFKGFEVEFIEQSVREVQADVAKLSNDNEMGKDASTAIKTSPNEIALNHTADQVDERYFRLRVWLDAPAEFIEQVESVTYERHPTFRNRYKTVSKPPFENRFKAWGEFSIKAEIKLKSGDVLRRQRYLSFSKN